MKKIKFAKISIFIVVVALITAFGCRGGAQKKEYIEQFPFTEEEMMSENFDLGILLEYAIFDNTKIDFVKSLICDTIKNNLNLVFTKFETIINDSAYFFFDSREREFGEYNYIGMIYLDIHNLDSMNIYNLAYSQFWYGINDIDKIINEIVKFYETPEMIAYHKARGIENNLSTIDKIVKYWKIDNIYIPKLYFHFDFLSFDCEDGFVEKVILAVNTVNRIMDEYSEKQYPDENIVLRPQIIIRMDFDVLYPPPSPPEYKESAKTEKKTDDDISRIYIDFDGDGKIDTATIIERIDSANSDIVYHELLISLTSDNKNHILEFGENIGHLTDFKVDGDEIEFGYVLGGNGVIASIFRVRYNQQMRKIQLSGFEHSYRITGHGGGHCFKTYNLLTGDYTVTLHLSNPVQHEKTYEGNKKMKPVFIEDLNLKNDDREIYNQLLSIGDEFEFNYYYSGGKPNDGIMTMTTAAQKVTLWLWGSGTATIDWGDGSKTDTIKLGIDIQREYTNATPRLITVYGKNIIHFHCHNNELTTLDVSRNTALVELSCDINLLTTLDLSQNIILEELYCGNNLFTELDLTANTALKVFNGINSQLIALDVSRNTALTHINCNYNQLSTSALNALFGTLHSNDFEKKIYIEHNLGTANSDTSIAERKGWEVHR